MRKRMKCIRIIEIKPISLYDIWQLARLAIHGHTQLCAVDLAIYTSDEFWIVFVPFVSLRTVQCIPLDCISTVVQCFGEKQCSVTMVHNTCVYAYNANIYGTHMSM